MFESADSAAVLSCPKASMTGCTPLNRTQGCLKVKECMDALAAGNDWQQPTGLQRQQLLEEGTGTQSQAGFPPMYLHRLLMDML